MNCLEETKLQTSQLPSKWNNNQTLIELEEFLQENWEERANLYDDNNLSKSQRFLTFPNSLGKMTIKTENYIGTITFKGEQMNIFPKMYSNEFDKKINVDYSQKHLLKNITEWISYCNKFNYPYIHFESSLEENDSIKDLLVSIYVKYIKQAFNRGIYYQYETKQNIYSCIKGKPNYIDYFTKKMTGGLFDKFECETSIFEIDNKLNQIIKYTCNIVLRNSNKRNSKELRLIIKELSEITDNRFSARDCDNIKLSKSQHDYQIILNLSKIFLLNKASSFESDDSESFCFLFPTEYLFEGFIGGFLQSAFDDIETRLQVSDMSFIDDIYYNGQSYGNAFTMRHDIVCEKKGKVFILDTKYKKIPRFENNEDLKYGIVGYVSQNDLYQVSEYAIKRGLQDAYLIYPLFRSEEVEPYFPTLQSIHLINDNIKCVNIHLLRVPFIFEDNAEDTKNLLKKEFEKIFNN